MAVANLKMNYSETPVSMGLASNGAMIEVFTSDKATFTILMTYPSGLSCMIAAGENWEAVPESQGGSKL